jgi:hypothetical protein
MNNVTGTAASVPSIPSIPSNASIGSNALGAGGPEFKSPRPDQIHLNQEVAKAQFLHCYIVVQLGNNWKNS